MEIHLVHEILCNESINCLVQFEMYIVAGLRSSIILMWDIVDYTHKHTIDLSEGPHKNNRQSINYIATDFDSKSLWVAFLNIIVELKQKVKERNF